MLSVSHRPKGDHARETRQLYENALASPEINVDYKLCTAGDRARSTSMRAWHGMHLASLTIGDREPCVSLRLRRYRAASSRDYLHQLACEPRARLQSSVDGVRIGSTWDLAQALHTQMIPCASVPPLSEQAAIVRFLDHADRRIRRYIRAKQKLIKLLEEQKQAIIHRAVTRGLDPNVRLKPSGVEWLGDVPEHWEMCRSRSADFSRRSGRSASADPLERHQSVSRRFGSLPVTLMQTGPDADELDGRRFSWYEVGDFA